MRRVSRTPTRLASRADLPLSGGGEEYGGALQESRMHKLPTVIALAALALLGGIAEALAQAYPARPITMVVPFPAGGPADVVGRIIIERMKMTLGQPFVIENVAGANGSIG